MSQADRIEAHRKALIDLSVLTEAELQSLWLAFDTNDVVKVREALVEILPLLGEKYGDMAGVIAADFYDDLRDEAAARGRFFADPAPLPTQARYEALARWGVEPILRGDSTAALTLVSGGLQRIVTDSARDTVTLNSRRDPAAYGWARHARSDGCSFCKMLAGRGEVYTQETVRFASHDHCHCAAAPSFEPGDKIDVHQYVASKRVQTDADRARVRKHLASMEGRDVSPQGHKTADVKPSGIDAMTREQVEKQISITEGLKDSEWRTTQLARLHARLKNL